MVAGTRVSSAVLDRFLLKTLICGLASTKVSVVDPTSEVQTMVAIGPLGCVVGSAEAAGEVMHQLWSAGALALSGFPAE